MAPPERAAIEIASFPGLSTGLGQAEQPVSGRARREQPRLPAVEFGLDPCSIGFDALLATKALEGVAVPDQAEFAVAVGATVFHDALSSLLSSVGRLHNTRHAALQYRLSHCTISADCSAARAALDVP